VFFAPRNDDNHIKPNNLYELFYYDRGWVSLGNKMANISSLKYENIPNNSLLWLRNHSEGKEERVFIYSKNKILWL